MKFPADLKTALNSSAWVGSVPMRGAEAAVMAHAEAVSPAEPYRQ